MSRENHTVNSARLTRENHCLVYPLVSHGGFFTVEDGWKLIGESKAPYGRNGQTTAIVFEKTSSGRESSVDMLADLEPGVYWVHGRIEELDIRAHE